MKIITQSLFASSVLLIVHFFGIGETNIISQTMNNNLKNDTFSVPHCFWWMPLTNNACSGKYSLAFLGTVKNINEPMKRKGVGDMKQKGIIEINKVLEVKNLKRRQFNNQKFFTSDCFYKIDVKKGDKVIVFCHEYEGDYAIGAANYSIFRIKSFESPFVKSAINYIRSDYNTNVLMRDKEVWKNHGLDFCFKYIKN